MNRPDVIKDSHAELFDLKAVLWIPLDVRRVQEGLVMSQTVHRHHTSSN